MDNPKRARSEKPRKQPRECAYVRSCPFHKLELREISELPATRMLGSSSCRTFRGSASALLRGIGVSWREVP